MKSKQKNCLIGLFVVITLLGIGQIAQAAPVAHTFVVNSNADSGDNTPGNCTCSTSTGSCTLRAAVEEANACVGDDIIQLQSGTTYPIGSTLVVDSPGSDKIDIYPGGTQRAKITTETHPTAFSVVKGILRLASIQLEYSGGITVSVTGQLEVHDSEFRNNNGNHRSGVYAGGGAIYNQGELTVTFSTFISNTTEGRGGAIASFGKQTAIVNSLFLSNSAQVEGGAIYNSSLSSYPDIYSFFSLLQSEVTSNTAPSGGGLALAGPNDTTHGTQVTISNSIIKGNSATFGGGISLLGNDWSGEYGGGADIYESEISGNTATDGGGIYSSNVKYLPAQFNSRLRNTTLSENNATGDGGGIYVNGRGPFGLYNVTITNNRADSDSTGGGQGGGVYLNDPDPRFAMNNSILAGNKDLTSGPFALVAYDCYGTIESLGYNLLGIMQAGVCTVSGQTSNVRSGTASQPLDPGLEPLSATYKEVAAMTAFHALKFNSPALNGGNPSGCLYMTTLITTDQRGEVRPRGGRCDLGAFESDIIVRKVFAPYLIRN